MSIFDRVSTLGKASISSLLSKGEKTLSIPVLEERIEQLVNGRKAVQASVAEATYRFNNAANNLAAHDATDGEMETNIKKLMSANGGSPTAEQKASAQSLAVGLSKMRKNRPAEVAQVADLKKQVDDLNNSLAQLNDRETEYKSQISSLKMQAASTKSLSQATSAVEQAGRAASTLDDSTGLAETIGIEHAKATSAFDSAMGAMARPADSVAKLDADDLINSIMNKDKSAAA